MASLDPYTRVRASDIVLSEETFDYVSQDPHELKTLSDGFTAVYEGHLTDGSSILASYGPKIEMKRYGATADEAYRALVEALERQGFDVR